MAEPSVSIIIPTLNEGLNLLDTVGFALAHSGPALREVIVVDDGCEDGTAGAVAARFRGKRVRVVETGGVGVPRARNAGAAVAEGEVFLFLDGHCFVHEGWLPPLLAALGSDPSVALVGPAFADIEKPTRVGCGNSWRDASLERVWLPRGEGLSFVPFHGGAAHGVWGHVFREVGGYDEGMTRWGNQDLEFCLRLWLLGYSVVAEPRSVVFHLFRERHPYTVDPYDVLYNKLRLAIVHFDEGRLARVIRAMLQFHGIERVLARALADGTWACREHWQGRHQRDVGWLFGRFGIPI